MSKCPGYERLEQTLGCAMRQGGYGGDKGGDSKYRNRSEAQQASDHDDVELVEDDPSTASQDQVHRRIGEFPCGFRMAQYRGDRL